MSGNILTNLSPCSIIEIQQNYPSLQKKRLTRDIKLINFFAENLQIIIVVKKELEV